MVVQVVDHRGAACDDAVAIDKRPIGRHARLRFELRRDDVENILEPAERAEPVVSYDFIDLKRLEQFLRGEETVIIAGIRFAQILSLLIFIGCVYLIHKVKKINLNP